MRRDPIVNTLLWIFAPLAALGLAAAVPSTGCVNTATDCAALGLPAGCTPGGGGAGPASASAATGTGGAGVATASSAVAGTASSASTAVSGSSASGTGTGGGAGSGAVCKARRAGDASDQTARRLDADAAGHLLVGGDFQGTLDFGVSALTASTTQGFVALLDAATLKPSWSRSLGATYLASALDASGDVIVAGSYTSAVPVDLGCGVLDANKSFFLAKIDPTKSLPSAACVFSKAFAAPIVRATLAVAGNGDIVLAGGSQGPANGPVELGTGPLPAHGGLDVVIARFTSTGSTQWSHAFGTPGDEAAVGVALDPASGDAFITGDFVGQLDFATGGNGIDSGAGKRDIFFAGFDPAGVPLWADHFKGPNDDRATGIAVVSDGIVLGGDYVGSIDLGTSHETSAMPSAFVVGKLKLDGSPLWAATLDGQGNGTFLSLAAAAGDGIVLTGSVTVSATTSDLLVASLDKKGKPLYQTTFPGTGLSRGLAVVAHGGVVDVAGGFDGTLDLGAAGKLQSQGGQDVFIAHLCP